MAEDAANISHRLAGGLTKIPAIEHDAEPRARAIRVGAITYLQTS